jgi:DNA repair protein RadA/Sms
MLPRDCLRDKSALRFRKESAQQIKLRGSRMAIAAGHLQIYAEMSIRKIVAAAESLAAKAVVIDSFKRPSAKARDGAGSIGRVRGGRNSCLERERLHIPVFLIGHVTKDSALAVPRPWSTCRHGLVL